MISRLASFKRKTRRAPKKKTTRLLALSPQDMVYQQLDKHFRESWIHPGKPKPQVHAIFEIVLTEESLMSYLRYRALVELSHVARHANEQLLFHGTARSCLLGDQRAKAQLCELDACLLCSVLRDSFDTSQCGKRHKFRRFGSGIYTTSCSSKADDYFTGVAESPFRVLLVNRVVVGNALMRHYNAVDLVEPPSGYHSIVGEPGGDLNYAETVVYTNDAIRPAYLMVYAAADYHQEVAVADLSSILSTLFNTPVIAR
ncbi:unnamed protein product [Mycena citricolor]|uniref:Poly [ADP-ribose] polymerase n=1 Tax=Mycena citricolor TaxID=2018698 RepID=A0AAD2K0A3_9AGAR|nr:unnamed protein product [Mycena citricolor]